MTDVSDAANAFVARLRAIREDEETPRTTWAPVDLTDALNGSDIPAPEILRRVDGTALLYAGKVHWFQGEPESCKTWCAGVAVIEVMDNGGNALWIDFEDDDRTAVARLRALGAGTNMIRERFTYIRPEEPLYDRQGRATPALIDINAVLEETQFDIIIIDGVTEAMVTEDLNLLDNADIAVWLRRVPKWLAKTGATVVCLDHVTKSKETQGRFAIGGQHKLAGLTGAAYAFEVIKPFGRALSSEPNEGSVFVKVTKDRAGYIRGKALDGRIAVMQLTAYPDGGVSVALAAPDTTPAPDLLLCRKIAEHLNVYDEQSGRAIFDALGGNEHATRTALKWMAEPDRLWITIRKSGRSHLHTLTKEGRDALT